MQPAATSQQALGNLQNFQSSMQDPSQMLSSNEQSLGVPGQQQEVSGLRQAITNTTNLLNQVAPSVMGRTQQSLVTSAQANRQIGNEQAPIQANLSDLGTKESNASSDLNTNLTRAQQLAALQAQGQSTKESNLENTYKALYGQEQDQAKAQSDAAAAAENKRQFDVSQGTEQQKLAEQKREADLKTVATPTQGDLATARNDLIKLQGGDGYVSPQTYSKAALQWANAGYSLEDFNKNFKQFKNPNNPYYTI